jgi:hypothetical protein
LHEIDGDQDMDKVTAAALKIIENADRL